MKNIIIIAFLLLTLATLGSCTKKEVITRNPTIFSWNQFAPKNFLATAD